ncbi:DUF5711 family protein [Vallitalea guaymasensis]|uniref:Uncharacterized protein n=1 Tax=Vallitalea guaymasensis TaxID=1185412 RepID=A0A8J8MB03_9FIRM|nr:DUF5711 family protein [Vallitalea guaymasensis]QUH29473.1 hypothetical protein HYG85_11310 [Vallitalea guaymasensis]
MKEQRIKIFLIMLLVIVSITAYVLVIRPKGFGFVSGKVKLEVLNNLEYNPTDKVHISKLGKNIVRSSKDGVTMMDTNGTTIWDKTFNMMNPKVIKENNYLAVADISARDLYLFDENGFVRDYNVGSPILMFDINENGIVAIIGQKNKGHVIELFDADGTKLIHRETFTENDGYPLAFDISEDGSKMVTSYLYVKGNSLVSNLTFFNFSDNGSDYAERVTGGFSIDETVVPEIRFLDNEHVAAVGDNGILFYKVNVIPEEIQKIEVPNEINKVNYTEDKLLVLYGRPIKNEDNYKDNSLVTYNKEGKSLNVTEFDNEITRLIGNENKYYVESELFIREYYNGKINWESTVKGDVKDIMPLGNNTFLIVLQNEYEVVKLTK